MHCSFVTALTYFQLDGGRYSLTKGGVNVRYKGKRYRGKTLSRVLARLGY